jgi:hypothetical protein
MMRHNCTKFNINFFEYGAELCSDNQELIHGRGSRSIKLDLNQNVLLSIEIIKFNSCA